MLTLVHYFMLNGTNISHVFDFRILESLFVLNNCVFIILAKAQIEFKSKIKRISYEFRLQVNYIMIAISQTVWLQEKYKMRHSCNKREPIP